MTWQQLEKIFNRALKHSFSKRKFLLVFPVMALCGLLTVICRTISHGVSQWMVMSTAFLPIFLCAGLLLAIGIVLTRIYHQWSSFIKEKIAITEKELLDEREAIIDLL